MAEITKVSEIWSTPIGDHPELAKFQAQYDQWAKVFAEPNDTYWPGRVESVVEDGTQRWVFKEGQEPSEQEVDAKFNERHGAFYKPLQTNLKYYGEGGEGYEDYKRDQLLGRAQQFAPQLGLTAAQLYENPNLVENAQALAEYSGTTPEEAQAKLASVGGVGTTGAQTATPLGDYEPGQGGQYGQPVTMPDGSVVNQGDPTYDAAYTQQNPDRVQSNTGQAPDPTVQAATGQTPEGTGARVDPATGVLTLPNGQQIDRRDPSYQTLLDQHNLGLPEGSTTVAPPPSGVPLIDPNAPTSTLGTDLNAGGLTMEQANNPANFRDGVYIGPGAGQGPETTQEVDAKGNERYGALYKPLQTDFKYYGEGGEGEVDAKGNERYGALYKPLQTDFKYYVDPITPQTQALTEAATTPQVPAGSPSVDPITGQAIAPSPTAATQTALTGMVFRDIGGQIMRVDANSPLAQSGTEATSQEWEQQLNTPAPGISQEFQAQQGITDPTQPSAAEQQQAGQNQPLPPESAARPEHVGTNYVPPGAPAGSTWIQDPANLTGLTEAEIWRDPNSDRIYQLSPEQASNKTALENTLSNIGIDTGGTGAAGTQSALNQLGEQFSQNPQTTIKDLMAEIMGAMNLPDYTDQMNNVNKEIEALQNERDDKIADVNDNPWLTEGVRRRRIQSITERYENKLANKVDYLQLLQSTTKDATQQAQWAAGMAVNLFDSNRKFQWDQFQFLTNQAQEDSRFAYQVQQQEFENQLDLIDLQGGGERDTQVITAGGRQLLVDKQTGEVLTDFGGAYKTGGGGSVIYGSGDTPIGPGLTKDDQRKIAGYETQYGIPVTSWSQNVQNTIANTLSSTQAKDFFTDYNEAAQNQSIEPALFLQNWAAKEDEKATGSFWDDL